MSQIDEEMIEKLYRLARIEPGDTAEMAAHFNRVLDYVAMLDEVDTRDVEPINCVLEEMTCVQAEDCEKRELDQEIWKENLADKVGTYLKTPKVL